MYTVGTSGWAPPGPVIVWASVPSDSIMCGMRIRSVDFVACIGDVEGEAGGEAESFGEHVSCRDAAHLSEFADHGRREVDAIGNEDVLDGSVDREYLSTHG
jgi:hypothetical protein